MHVRPAQQHVLADRVGGHRVDVAGGVLEVLQLQLEGGDAAAVLQLDRLFQRRVVGDVADGLHRRLQRIVAVEEAVLDHVEHDGRGPDLQIGRHFRHVRVAHDDVQATIALGVGVGLVARVDDRARRGRRPRDLLADVLGALAQAVVEAARRLQHLAGPREDLPGDEEGDERLGQPLEADVTADQVVLVAAVGVARRVGVVLEEQDVAGDPVLAQALLGLVQQVLDDALAGLVVDDQLGDVVALGRGVLRVEAGVQVEPRAVFQEHVGVARAGDDLLEQVAGDVVGRQAALAVQGTGEAVLVLEAEDPALHRRDSCLSGAAPDFIVQPSVARLTWPRRGVGERLGGHAAELAPLLGAVQHGDLEVPLGERLVLGDRQGAHPELQRLVEAHRASGSGP